MKNIQFESGTGVCHSHKEQYTCCYPAGLIKNYHLTHSWKANTITTLCRFPPLGWQMLIFEGPEKISSWGFHGVEGFSVGPAEKNYRCYTRWITTTGSERISDTVVLFPLQRYTYDPPAPPTQKEVVQEAAKALGESLSTLATKILRYTHLSNFSGIK